MWAFTKYMSQEVLKWIGVIRVVLRSAGALMYIEKLTKSTEKCFSNRGRPKSCNFPGIHLLPKWHEAYILTKSAIQISKQ